MILPIYAGEVVHKMKDGSTLHFRPTGPMLMSRGRHTKRRGAKEDIESFGKGGALGARFFVGLNVGDVPTYSPEDVVNLVYKLRTAQGAPGDMSVIAQLGVYTDSEGRRIDEKSVQVILLDLSGDPPEAFTKAMLMIGEELRMQLKQERVIVEIQKGGVVQEVFSATDPKLLEAAG